MSSRCVVLGVTGSIAAYKACELVRLLVKAGCEVRVVMTRSAQAFVTPLTFKTLSQNSVATELFEAPTQWEPGHISLAVRADVVCVAPATANIIAKMAHGIADDMLSSTLLATRAPIVGAPAMNDGMWRNEATQLNIATLKARGVIFVSPEEGPLACGTSGPGRLANPTSIAQVVLSA